MISASISMCPLSCIHPRSWQTSDYLLATANRKKQEMTCRSFKSSFLAGQKNSSLLARRFGVFTAVAPHAQIIRFVFFSGILAAAKGDGKQASPRSCRPGTLVRAMPRYGRLENCEKPPSDALRIGHAFEVWPCTVSSSAKYSLIGSSCMIRGC
jgi:hypothetical protein